MKNKAALVIMAAALFSLLVASAGVQAEVVPLRQGTVISTLESEGSSYIQAKDADGKEFWVITTYCILAEGAKIEVIAGTRYNNIKNEKLDKVFDDAYTAQLIKVDGKEITGFSAHGLPTGCVILKR